MMFVYAPLNMLKKSAMLDNTTEFNNSKKRPMKILLSKSRQIVQTQDSNNSKVVEKSYLGKKDNSFERQTVAKVIDRFRISNGKSNIENKGKSVTAKSSNKSKTGKVQLANLGIGLPVLVGKKETKNNTQNTRDDHLMNEVAAMASASNDRVENVPLSDISRLNTTEYKHYGFFQRIRSQLEQHWGSTLKEKAKKIYKSGRKISSDNDFITNIEVELDKNGKITNIFIIGTSGVKELDDAAIESFNKAGPFPNPPSDLLLEGIAKIKWGFVVKS